MKFLRGSNHEVLRKLGKDSRRKFIWVEINKEKIEKAFLARVCPDPRY